MPRCKYCFVVNVVRRPFTEVRNLCCTGTKQKKSGSQKGHISSTLLLKSSTWCFNWFTTQIVVTLSIIPWLFRSRDDILTVWRNFVSNFISILFVAICFCTVSTSNTTRHLRVVIGPTTQIAHSMSYTTSTMQRGTLHSAPPSAISSQLPALSSAQKKDVRPQWTLPIRPTSTCPYHGLQSSCFSKDIATCFYAISLTGF